MKKTVFKYPIPKHATKFSIMLPMGFKFLRAMYQGDGFQIWAEVEKDNLKAQVNFELFGTGQDIPASAKYLATYDEGPFVLHLYQMN